MPGANVLIMPDSVVIQSCHNSYVDSLYKSHRQCRLRFAYSLSASLLTPHPLHQFKLRFANDAQNQQQTDIDHRANQNVER